MTLVCSDRTTYVRSTVYIFFLNLMRCIITLVGNFSDGLYKDISAREPGFSLLLALLTLICSNQCPWFENRAK